MLVSIAGGRMRLVLRSPVRARRRVAAAGVVVAVGLVVGGCTGEEPAEPDLTTSTVEAEPEPTEEPEPTPTETGPAMPERPAAMEKDDAEGAAAAAEYFLELYSYVMTTGDTSEWEVLSLDSCTFCQGAIEQAGQIAQREDVFEGGGAVANVDDPGFYSRDEATGIFPLDVHVVQEPMSIRSEDGEELFAQKRTDDIYRAELGLSDGEWVVVEISLRDAS
ncbi:hypothetical protein IF650_18900 [Cellulosimicrobium terreum]|nr:hypothetical protein [Cellulosimicrobium terreum]